MSVLVLALSAAVQGQMPSLDELRATVERMPESAAAHSNYGAGLKGAGQIDSAIEQFEAALALDPLYGRAYNNMGNALQTKGEWQMAAAAHGTAIVLMPSSASAYSNLGNALREMGEHKLAIGALTSAVSLSPAFAAAYSNLGSATLAYGDPTLAARWHGKAAEITGWTDPLALSNLGAALEVAGKLDEAGAALDMGLKHQPDSVSLLVNRGNIYRKLGQLSKAVDAYTRAVELEPNGADAPTAFNNLAATLVAEGRLERAMEGYGMALALKPDHAAARTNRDKLPISTAYRELASYELAVLASRAARELLATAAARSRRRGSEGASRVAPKHHTEGGDVNPPALLAPALHRVTRFLRRLETNQLSSGASLWASRGVEVSGAITASVGATEADGRYSITAFAWGGVWYQALAPVFAHPACRVALHEQAVAVVLGSSIGFEAFFVGLTFGVPTVGVELLNSLVGVSEDARLAHSVPRSIARFDCADAVTFNLPAATTLVYVDDTAWDTPTITQVAQKLARELPRGAVVVHNTPTGYEDPARYLLLASYDIQTSWDLGHMVHVHQRV